MKIQKEAVRLDSSPAFVVSFRQNKTPFAGALGDWFPLSACYLTGKASPNDSEIVIVIIVGVIGEAQQVFHHEGIIAQTTFLTRVFHRAPRLTSARGASAGENPAALQRDPSHSLRLTGNLSHRS